MLSEGQIREIREHLEKAQNPLFFFDNDADGLASFLLLRRAIGRGKGVAIKSFPDLNINYLRKIQELKPDYIFILDKPTVSKGFLDEVHTLGLPLVWIDHHDISPPEIKDFYYYNGFFNDKKNEPVSYLCYKVAAKKEDMWIAMIGCLGDGYLPEFAVDFEKKYPELWGKNIKEAFQGLYGTDIGRITRILNFSLKDRTSNVVTMLKFMISAKSPTDVLDEDKARTMLQRFRQLNGKCAQLVEKAKGFAKGKVLFFQYGGELSISADIANELFYLFPDKIIVVAYIRGAKANVSMRGKHDIRKMTLEAIKGLEGATGGGHEHSTGAQVAVEDLPKFKENLVRLI